MKAQVLLLLTLVAPLRIKAISNGVASPDCASLCWDNSRLLSLCTDKANCFCGDSNFQSAVFQCLYSQCETAQFGSAIHFALMECSDADTETHNVLPHLIHHQKFRKRYNTYSGSGSVLVASHESGYASASHTYSATFRHATGPPSGYSRTRSVSLIHKHGHSQSVSKPLPSLSFASRTISFSLSTTTISATLA